MGIFSKIAGLFMNPMIAQGISQAYDNFLNAPSEFNPDVMPCSDVNYSFDYVKAFLEKYDAGFTNQGVQNHVHVFYLEFENWGYLCNMFMHYARALSVTTEVITREKDSSRLLDFCNNINRYDLVHQVGIVFDEDQQKYKFRITRQFLLTPNIGSADTFAQLLRELREYAESVANLDVTSNIWQKYAHANPRCRVGTAEDFWFNHHGSDSILSGFVKNVDVIEENSEKTVHGMIPPLGSTVVFESMPMFQNGTITTYKRFPYIMSMSVMIIEGQPSAPTFNADKVAHICNRWNSYVHFAPSRAIPVHLENGCNAVMLRMTGWFAEDCNTRTFSDFLCSMQKATMMISHDLRSK